MPITLRVHLTKPAARVDRRGLCPGLDSLHWTHAQATNALQHLPRRPSARGLLLRAGGANPALGARIRHIDSSLSVLRRHYPVVIPAGGVVLISMDILIFTGEFTVLNQTVDT